MNVSCKKSNIFIAFSTDEQEKKGTKKQISKTIAINVSYLCNFIICQK